MKATVATGFVGSCRVEWTSPDTILSRPNRLVHYILQMNRSSYAPHADSLVAHVLATLGDGPLTLERLSFTSKVAPRRLLKMLDAPVRHGWIACNDGLYSLGGNASTVRRLPRGVVHDEEGDAAPTGIPGPAAYAGFNLQVSKLASLEGTPFGPRSVDAQRSTRSLKRAGAPADRTDVGSEDGDDEDGEREPKRQGAEAPAKPFKVAGELLPIFRPDVLPTSGSRFRVAGSEMDDTRRPSTQPPPPSRTVSRMAPIVRRRRQATRGTSKGTSTTAVPARQVETDVAVLAAETVAVSSMPGGDAAGGAPIPPSDGGERLASAVVMPAEAAVVTAAPHFCQEKSMAALPSRWGRFNDGTVVIQHDGRSIELSPEEAAAVTGFLSAGVRPAQSARWHATMASDGEIRLEAAGVSITLESEHAGSLISFLTDADARRTA